MAEKHKVKDFPDISNKLAAPNKKSVFERHKAEAEAKRQREEEETAAVYQDFVKSFDDEGAPSPEKNSTGTRGNLGGSSSGVTGGFSKRHFSGPPGRGGRAKSGPGSLGPPPPTLSRKKGHDGSPPVKREGLFAFEDVSSSTPDPKTALQHSDDEDVDNQRESEERAIPKPTLRLSSLPPGTSTAAIKAALPSNLTIEGLKILPLSSGGGTDRQSASAVVTLAKDTPALDIDTAVSALQNRYMGRGFYLSISRHLSSSSANFNASYNLPSSSSSLPFNARPITGPTFPRGSSGGPHRGGFAPPTSYSSIQGQFGRGAPQVQVTVTPPSDLKQLKLIHRTLESLLTHGPEFEALLMSRKLVQNDERWAWLWNSRSIGGVYYRWRLWDLLTGFSKRARQGRNFNLAPQQLFENGAVWAAPEQKLPFEYTTELQEFISDSDYNSSEDEDSGDEGRRRYAHHHGGAPPPDSSETDVQAYLNPMHKAKLVHLLARLPTTNAKLRRGDVARVTAFAIQHAGAGADEVVQTITANVHRPFAYTAANPAFQKQDNNASVPEPSTSDDPAGLNKSEESMDTASAKLIGLYIISDILSTSSTSGVRQAWRYRSLFESCLRQHQTFAHLGRLDKKRNWGRLRAEKWKRSVQSLLGLWEGWCVFPQETWEEFTRNFAEPPLTKEEEEEEAARRKEAEEEAAGKTNGAREKGRGKWRSVEDHEMAAPSSTLANTEEIGTEMDVDGAPMRGENGAGYDEDGDLDGEPMSDADEDIDGEPMSPSTPSSPASPMQDSEDIVPPTTEASTLPPKVLTPAEDTKGAGDDGSRRTALAASIAARLGSVASTSASTLTTTPPAAAATGSTVASQQSSRKRQRPKAEDMFADSDEEDHGREVR